jgi:hypothetical protein
VSHKSRLRRIDAGVRWLETEGVFIGLQLVNKLQGMLQEMSDHAAAHPDVAARWKKIQHLLPPPRAKARPPVPRPTSRVLPILLGVSSASARKRPDAAVPAAPQDEAVRVQAKPHPEERRVAAHLEGCEPARPPPDPLPGQPVSLPPPDMEIRPTQWRARGAQDYYEDEPPGTNGRCLTEYDVLRDEDDDDDDDDDE